MEFINLISGPVIGGIIGYVTNYIAIKMLFRPLHPVKIGKYTLPFTPGIVPKRKDKLGAVLGSAVVERFFTYDDLEEIFLSDYFKGAVTDSVIHFLYDDTKKNNRESLPVSETKEQLAKKIKEGLCIRILAGLIRADIPSIISSEGPAILKKSFGSNPASKLITDEFIDKISKPLGEGMEHYLLKEGRHLLMPILDQEFLELSQHSPADVMNDLEIEKELMHKVLNSFYISFMKTRTRGIVEHIDISGIIAEKVRQMDAEEIESLTLSVVNRELRYVILLGALLGIIIGAVNIFI